MNDRLLDWLVILLATAVVGVVVFGITSSVPAVLVAVAGMLAMPLLLGLLSDLHEERPPAPDQRDVLVRGLVELLPQLPDGLVWQAEKTLATVGVRQLVPDGEPLDPQRHHVVGTETSGDAARANTVARTVRPGYVDGNRIVRHPKVVVYTMDKR